MDIRNYTIDVDNDHLLLIAAHRHGLPLAFKCGDVRIYIAKSAVVHRFTWYAITKFVMFELQRHGHRVSELRDLTVASSRQRKRKDDDPCNFMRLLL